MSYGNNVTEVGNLTRDPELRFTNSGMAVTSGGIAINYKHKDKEEVSFFDWTAFGEFGEHVAESLTKGMRVIIVGRLQQRSWETAEGDKRSKVEIVVENMGPDLRWATCEVTRSERADGGGGGGGRRDQPPVDTYDEEPF